MTPIEKRSAAGLATIYATRMLGLFMILPVFTLYAPELPGYSAVLAGLAIGIYGLTQALFQIPFGMLSDRIGRKPVITAGLLLFAAGGVVAALADHIWLVIAGRAIQGAGAIAAAVMAMNADLTREEHRTKAMAIIGMGIGFSFMLSLILGPLVASSFGLSGIFWSTTGLAILGIAVLHGAVPTPVRTSLHRDVEPVPAQFAQVLKNPELLRLDFGILVVHFIMTATFVALPLVLRDQVDMDPTNHYLLYLGVLVVSVALMVPFIIIAERRHRLKEVFVGAILVLLLAQTGLSLLDHSLFSIIPLLILYFAAFNLLEASLPSLVSRISPPDSKGTAMGVYSTSQFVGAFLGGAAGGWLLAHFGTHVVFTACAVGSAIWLAIAATMNRPRQLSSHMIQLGDLDEVQARLTGNRLRELEGVAEAVVVAEDGIAYLKIDRRTVDQQALEAFSAEG